MRKLAYLFHTSYNNIWLMRRQTRHNGNKTSLFFCILSFDSLQHAFHVCDAFSIDVKVPRPDRTKNVTSAVNNFCAVAMAIFVCGVAIFVRAVTIFVRAMSNLFVPWLYLFVSWTICSCRGYICSCREQFVRAVAIFVRVVAICLCRDTCGPPYKWHWFLLNINPNYNIWGPQAIFWNYQWLEFIIN